MFFIQKRGIYLGSCIARHLKYNIIYQDIQKDKYNCDLGGDMLTVALDDYDYIIATPPCNFWSKVNFSYLSSEYSLKTKHLLPDIIIKLSKIDKPFIIENVKNRNRMIKYGIYDLIKDLNLNFIELGRHIYISNIDINFLLKIPQQQDFKYGGIRINNDGYNQGGLNVYNVFEAWLERIDNNKYLKKRIEFQKLF